MREPCSNMSLLSEPQVALYACESKKVIHNTLRRSIHCYHRDRVRTNFIKVCLIYCKAQDTHLSSLSKYKHENKNTSTWGVKSYSPSLLTAWVLLALYIRTETWSNSDIMILCCNVWTSSRTMYYSTHLLIWYIRLGYCVNISSASTKVEIWTSVANMVECSVSHVWKYRSTYESVNGLPWPLFRLALSNQDCRTISLGWLSERLVLNRIHSSSTFYVVFQQHADSVLLVMAISFFFYPIR